MSQKQNEADVKVQPQQKNIQNNENSDIVDNRDDQKVSSMHDKQIGNNDQQYVGDNSDRKQLQGDRLEKIEQQIQRKSEEQKIDMKVDDEKIQGNDSQQRQNDPFDSYESVNSPKIKQKKQGNKEHQKNGQEEEETYVKFSELHPAQEKFASKSKSLSLEFDIKLGWMPKSQITGPIPLAYTHPDADQIISQKADKQLVLYYGQRFNNSFDVHRQFYEKQNNGKTIKKYQFHQFHLCKSKFLQMFFKKYYSDFQYDQKRQVGMVTHSPIKKNTLTNFINKIPDDQPLQFDSYFEGGNLDAVYFQNGQYRLFLRTDANTRGHLIIVVYQDRVTSKKPGKYYFRIMNMSKPVSLYQRGMKPYTRIKSQSGSDNKWSQNGTINVRYGNSPLNDQYQDIRRKMYSLKFEYIFQTETKNDKKSKNKKIQSDKPFNMQVQFCYGIPFVYSDLIAFLNQYREDRNFYLNKLCYSLSGVEIPLITITENQQKRDDNAKNQVITKQNEGKNEQKAQATGVDKNKTEKLKKQQKQNNTKYVILIIGRVHPGETHGSHIINGLIKGLLQNTPQSKMLRNNIIFKIVPMLNPDGVIIGNTRTSFSGKDLNRVYSDKTQFVYPQITGIRDYIKKIKSKYGKNFLFVIDVHGHSTRKNSFFFGPEYPVFDDQYNKCRMLPRIFANITEIFRYYSCKFRLSSTKQKTCRGYFNSKNIVRVYTHETSIHSYYNFSQRNDVPFTQQILQNFGKSMMLTIHDYVSIAFGFKAIQVPQPVKKKKRKKQKKDDQNQDEIEQISDSDQMDSDKADSQDENQDYDPMYLQTFYNRINETKEYFFEELMEQDKIDKKSKKVQVKKKKQTDKNKLPKIQEYANEPVSPAYSGIRQFRMEDQLLADKFTKKKKAQWIPKLEFNPRKKQFLEYQKLSSVVFGGVTISKESYRYQSENIQKQKKDISKKKINQPKVKANLVTLTPLTEEQKLLKKLEQAENPSNNTFGNKWKNSTQNFKYLYNNSTHRSSLSPTNNYIEDKQTKFDNPKKIFYDLKLAEKLLQTDSHFNLLAKTQSKLTLQGFDSQRDTYGYSDHGKSLKNSLNQSKAPKQFNSTKTIHINASIGNNFNSTKSRNSYENIQSLSVRTLPRKKSIKSFKQQENYGRKKILKSHSLASMASNKKINKGGEPLARNLPYLKKVMTKL